MTESAAGGGTSGIAGEPRETRPATGTATVASAPAGAVREAGQQGQAGFGAVFAVVTAGVCVVNLDLFIVNVAIPSIGRSFGGANLANLSWVLNAYAIVFAALLVPAGRAADLIGRRAAFLAGMIVFGLASAACAAAPDVWVLVAARVVQAAGGALLMPASLGLLLAAAAPEKRAGTIRAWTSVGGAAAALGPVIGGALVAASWHWVFLVNVPIVAVAVAAGLRVLRPDPPAAARAGLAAERAEALPDTLGAAVFTVAIGALALALVKSGGWGWTSPATLGLIGGGGSSPGPVHPQVSHAPVAGDRAAPAAPAHVRHRHGGERGVRHRVRRDAAARHPLVPGRLGLVRPADRPRRGTGAAARAVLGDRGRPLARKIGPGPVAAAGCAIYAAGCARSGG